MKINKGFLSRQQRGEIERKKEVKRRRGQKRARYNPTTVGPCKTGPALIDDILGAANVAKIIRHCLKPQNYKRLIVKPRADRKAAQEAQTLVRRNSEAAKQDKTALNKATKFRQWRRVPRASSAEELEQMITAEVVPAQASCEEGGEMAGGKKRKRAITDASKIAAVVRKKQRAALVKQLQLRKYIWNDKIASVKDLNSRSYDELKQIVLAHIEREPTGRVVPAAPHVLAGYELLGSAHTELSRQLHRARAELRNKARSDFFKLAPDGGEVRLGEGAVLPPTVGGTLCSPLRDAGLDAGAHVWNADEQVVYKIVAPEFVDPNGAASAELVCLLYPVAKYSEADEEAMRRNPANFVGALVCSHTHVLSWLGNLPSQDGGDDNE
jgi:hypothetical protein